MKTFPLSSTLFIEKCQNVIAIHKRLQGRRNENKEININSTKMYIFGKRRTIDRRAQTKSSFQLSFYNV